MTNKTKIADAVTVACNAAKDCPESLRDASLIEQLRRDNASDGWLKQAIRDTASSGIRLTRAHVEALAEREGLAFVWEKWVRKFAAINSAFALFEATGKATAMAVVKEAEAGGKFRENVAAAVSMAKAAKKGGKDASKAELVQAVRVEQAKLKAARVADKGTDKPGASPAPTPAEPTPGSVANIRASVSSLRAINEKGIAPAAALYAADNGPAATKLRAAMGKIEKAVKEVEEALALILA